MLMAISSAKSLSPLYAAQKGVWLFDDLGEEKSEVVLYKDAENPMDNLLSARYEAYINSGLLTHFTSNKQPDDIEHIYGTRIADRFSEWVQSIFFEGETLRIDPNLTDPDEA